MFDVTSLLAGFAAGLLLGVVLAGLWTAARLRAQTHARLIEGAERAQRAEAAASELRWQSEQERAEVLRLRQELAEVQQARASAETRAEEALKNLQEQKTLLSQARQDLVEAFQALSGEALRQNNEAFLNLAKTSFETLQAEAKGELAQRQQAIDELVKPLQEALKRYEEQLHTLEQSRLPPVGLRRAEPASPAPGRIAATASAGDRQPRQSLAGADGARPMGRDHAEARSRTGRHGGPLRFR